MKRKKKTNRKMMTMIPRKHVKEEEGEENKKTNRKMMTMITRKHVKEEGEEKRKLIGK